MSSATVYVGVARAQSACAWMLVEGLLLQLRQGIRVWKHHGIVTEPSDLLCLPTCTAHSQFAECTYMHNVVLSQSNHLKPSRGSRFCCVCSHGAGQGKHPKIDNPSE